MIKELRDWWNNASPRPEPNCAICKWASGIVTVSCTAQGFCWVSTVYNNRQCKRLFEERDDTCHKRNMKAVTTAFQYGSIDGAHHKMWVIDQMVKALLGDAYEQTVEEYKNCEDGPYEWDEGIAP